MSMPIIPTPPGFPPADMPSWPTPGYDRYGQEIEGIFNPKRLDSLRPEAFAFIGQRLRFRYLWEIDDSDNYVGQIAWQPPAETRLGWVPSEDIDAVGAVSFKEGES